MHFLLTNDDGIHAPGLEACEKIARVLSDDVWIVAPETDQSGVSHSLSLNDPLRLRQLGERHYAVKGTPTDCVIMGARHVMPEVPDLVLSGVNRGRNAAEDVLYSGTVAAAIEGAFFGVMSIAVSLAMNQHPNFERTARQARELIEQLLAQHTGPAQLWNINFPETTPEGPRGVKVLPMGVHRYGEYMERRKDPRGRTYYWSGSDKQLSPPCPVDTDVQGMLDGYISMTPLQFDMTQRQQLADYRGVEWKLG